MVNHRYNRLMEKENKKSRDDARREYNDTVRVSSHIMRLRAYRPTFHLPPASLWSFSSASGIPGIRSIFLEVLPPCLQVPPSQNPRQQLASEKRLGKDMWNKNGSASCQNI